MAFYSRALLTVLFLLLLPNNGRADALKLDANKPLKLDYHSSAWNRNPNVIDHGWILVRDAKSGKMARVEMQETDVNTGLFVGYYQIGFQADGEIQPEIYLAPVKMMESTEQLKKIDSLISEGTLLKKPFFLRRETKNLQAISVFDVPEQAVRAFQDFKAGQPVVVDRAALELQARAKATAEAQKIAMQVAAQLSERQRLEAEEKRKREELVRQQSEMDAAEKARRAKAARTLADDAMALYKREDYVGAEAKFAKATELDPSNTSFYFSYGVTLYKIQKYNNSLVALKLAKSGDFNPLERDYFIGLNHMKLKEYDQALSKFSAIKEKNDKVLSGSASFFAGVIEFQKENYDGAKAHFEYTIDNSTDPKLDQQAEAYIEQIANIKMFLAQKGKTFILGFNWGLMYDSNILNQALANAQTSLSGIRAGYGGSLEYRPIYTEKHEFSAVFNFSDMYSWDTSFQPKTEFQNTDPLVGNLSFPYKFKGSAFGKPYQLTATPAFENTYMNIDDSKSGIGKREQILSSTIARADNTFVMADDWFATYSLEARIDNSMISTADDDNQSANKVTMSTSQTFFKDKKKTTAVIYDGALALNMAKGKNMAYQRIDLGTSYTAPWIADTTINGRVGAFYSKYPTNTSGRLDDGLVASLGLRRPISTEWSSILSLSYLKNISNIDSYSYDKYSLLCGVAYSGGF